MATVPALYETGLRQLEKEGLSVDFSQVEAVDSAAVGMMLGWAKAAKRTRHELRVRGLPEGMLSLARLYGVGEMLPQSS
jgi:phospholipid transport system transporter-binding protein